MNVTETLRSAIDQLNATIQTIRSEIQAAPDPVKSPLLFAIVQMDGVAREIQDKITPEPEVEPESEAEIDLQLIRFEATKAAYDDIYEALINVGVKGKKLERISRWIESELDTWL